MNLTFLGAAHEVTGSRYLLEACGKQILVDYGMEQGSNLYENAELPVSASAIDYVFLTHAHIDHSGWLPLLYKRGFRGKIFTTQATADLCGIMLLDSAHIQEMEAEWKNRKAARKGLSPEEPLYSTDDAKETILLFAPCEYRKTIDVCDGITVQMIDVGHMLGSASIQVSIEEDGKTTKLVFSGDIGNTGQPLLRDPRYFTEADYVIMESTYGDRSHGETPDFIGTLVDVLNTTFARGGNVVIPSFAVGRTQELLYFLRQIKQEGLITAYPEFTVYMDSPLAIEATEVFKEHMYDYMDQETVALLKQGINPIKFDGLKLAQTADESKLINEDQTPKVIISASGMCTAGRIRHHLKHNLWREESTVLFVGYQSVGTLGRILQDGADEVKLFGETISVRADIRKLRGISGHADNNGLMKWIGSFESKPRHVFVVHGDDEVTDLFAGRLQNELGLHATAPFNGESWDLTTDVMLQEGNKQRIEHKYAEVSKPKVKGKATKPKAEEAVASSTYTRLLKAGRRIADLIETMERSSNKKQNKLATALLALVKQYKK